MGPDGDDERPTQSRAVRIIVIITLLAMAAPVVLGMVLAIWR
ncbi:MAG: hypothetical protein QOG87_263 [Actinomycetota bacterium]|jgi:hypothetical protein